MTAQERIQAINNAVEKNNYKAMLEQNRKDITVRNLKLRILDLMPRIKDLVAVGDVCWRNNIVIVQPKEWGKDPDFVTEGTNHELGFYVRANGTNRYWENAIGISGGGICRYELVVYANGHIEVEGYTIDDVIYVLKRFVQEYDGFERSFYAAVDKLNNN